MINNSKLVPINKASCGYFSRPSMKHLLLLFAITISLTLNAQTNMVQSPGATKSPGGETQKKAGYSYTIIPSVNKTWGYDIYLQKRLFIHQPSKPGLPGNEGFKTKADTKKVARLVIGKIKKGKMPPNVTIEELKKIKVL
jgi:hypothetical protein